MPCSRHFEYSLSGHLPPTSSTSSRIASTRSILLKERGKPNPIANLCASYSKPSHATTNRNCQPPLVPAHAGIFENEVADLLAKRGADGITSGCPPTNTDIQKTKAMCADIMAGKAPSLPPRADGKPRKPSAPCPSQGPGKPNPPSPPPSVRTSSRTRTSQRLFAGVDYSMWAPPRKKPKVQNKPSEIQVWLCPHGSDFDSFIDLPPPCWPRKLTPRTMLRKINLIRSLLLFCLVRGLEVISS